MTKTAFLILCGLVSAFALPNARIIGGQEAILGECPYQVSIRFGQDGSTHLCSGSIVDNRTIITTASCINGLKPEDLKAVLGTNVLIGGGKTHSISDVYPHALYDAETIQYDVAALKVDPIIEFNKFTQPIEMAEEEVEAGQQLKISGWGMVNYPGSLPNNLQTLKVSAISNEECQSAFEGEIVDNKNICGMPRDGKGLCFGDSGNPVVNTQKQQVGIVSWGVPCAQGKPEVFTSTLFFKGWIDGHKDEQ